MVAEEGGKATRDEEVTDDAEASAPLLSLPRALVASSTTRQTVGRTSCFE